MQEVIVRTDNLSVVLEGSKVLEDIKMEVYRGSMVGLIGPNGAGKTTLLRLLLGLLMPSRGTVEILDTDPRHLGARRESIGYLPQRSAVTPQFPLSALDVVCMGLVTPGLAGKPLNKHHRKKARECLEKVGVLSLENRPFEQLSGGEQQRVFLARALIKDPHLLLLDEPNAGLDMPTQNRFMALLKNLQQEQGLTVIMVSHDLAVVAKYTERLFCINRTMHVHGSPSEVMNSPLLWETYRCEYELLFGKERRMAE